MSVAENLLQTHSEKTSNAMKADRSINRIMFKNPEASPGEKLDVTVPKLNKDEVLVPGSLSLVFNINLSGGHENNFLVQNVTRALVDKLVVKFAGQTLQDTVGYDIYKTFEDLFLSKEKRDEMILEGIQSESLSKTRSGAADKNDSSPAENKLNEIFGKKYRIRLDHQILSQHGVFYPQALYNDLTFELILAKAAHVVKGSDTTKLKYRLTNIEIEYEMIRSKTLADEADSFYSSGKEFYYDHVMHSKVVEFKKNTDTRINIKVDAQRRSLKAILLLFIEPYTDGARDSEKFIFPDLTKVEVTINGSPSMLNSGGIEAKDMWEEARRLLVKEKNKTEHMDMTKFYTGDKFGLVIDLRSMADQSMHGSGKRIVNSSDGVFLQILRKGSGSGNVNCHVFVISDAQFNIQGRQMESVQY